MSALRPGSASVVAQDADSRDVLVLAHTNKAAIEYTLREGVAAFLIRSRDRLWVKGKSSGNVLDVVEVRVKCE